MRIFHIHNGGVQELTALPAQMPAQGFVWIACGRPAFQARLAEIQARLQTLVGLQLVDLHVSDLLNAQLPSHYDYTSQYDLLVFRRLATAQGDTVDSPVEGDSPASPLKRSGPPVLRRIDTSPVGFAVFDQLLLTVHPADCAVRDAYAARLLASLPTSNGTEGRSSPVPGARVPASPADLMLRVVNQMVDGYLDLRRELTRQLDHWQTELLHPRTRFNQWDRLLQARMALHQLDEICEDQRTAIQGWMNGLELPTDKAAKREQELLKLRGRDVIEHIERVVHHVRRLEHNAETTVQMHFSVQGNRTNDIMRTLTVLTAIFLPLNLITGIFGMNFDSIPLLHSQRGFWWAMAAMGVVAVGLVLVFWRKRYLDRDVGRSGR